jgi:xylulokinase
MTKNLPYVLGLDLGSSSCKVCAMDTHGVILGSESEPYPTLVPHPTWAEQNPETWLPALAQATKRLLIQLQLNPSQALGLAITSAAHIMVLLDEDGQVLRNAMLWSDQRSAPQAQALANSAGDTIFEITNNWPTATWSLPHLAWVAEHEPEILAKTRHAMLNKDYIAYLLTGRITTDPSAAVSAMLLDVRTGTWSQHLCDKLGIDTAILPEVLPSAAEIASLNATGAATLGLTQATRVFNGSMDSTAETFAAGVRKEGQFVIRLASAGGLHVISRPARVDRQLISYPYGAGDYWLSQAGTNTCATAVAWAYTLFTQDTTHGDFDGWSRLASASPPGANGVMFHPYLSGERCPYWDGGLRAAFTGMALDSQQRDMARAVYEGTSYALRDAAGVLEKMGYRFTEINIVGGGARSRLWMQIIANVFNCPVRPTPAADSSAGAALYSLIGLGVFAGFDAVPSDLLVEKEMPALLPEPAWGDFYQAQFKKYLAVQTHVSAISHYDEVR